MTDFKSPLTIYVVWHPGFTDGIQYANLIYKTFCRDANNPLARNIGIPVYFRSATGPGESVPIPIAFEESDKNAVVLLIDDTLFNDLEWDKYVQSLLAGLSETNRIYPVALSQYAYYLEEVVLSKQQFIRADHLINEDNETQLTLRWAEIRNRLLHDFARLMKQMDSVSESQQKAPHEVPTPPVKLFISHAKRDGLKLASDFRDYVESNTKLNTFFDANDIADGYDFEHEIGNSIDRETALVVFNTDEYSNREWCRIEVLLAKRHKCPIVVVNLLEQGERRSFPYIGNVPTIRWKNDFDAIIELALLQVLNNLYSKEFISKHVQLYNLKEHYECVELTSPPELFTYIDIERIKVKLQGSKEMLVIYNDPPLGTEELNVLNDIDTKIHFTTPSHLFNFYQNGK